MREIIHPTNNYETDHAWVSNSNISWRSVVDPEDARFLIEVKASGDWSIAVRGYNDGHPLGLTQDDFDFNAVDTDGRRYPVLDAMHELTSVDRTEVADFREAMRQPERRDDLAAQLLEVPQPGIYELWRTDPGKNEVPTAVLEIASPELVAVRWMERSLTRGHKSVLKPSDPVISTVVKDGAELQVIPYEQTAVPTDSMILNAIAERVKAHPITVRQSAEMTSRLAGQMERQREAILAVQQAFEGAQ